MDPFNDGKIEEHARNTIEKLAEKEKENKIPFKDWPNTPVTKYELEPKRRNSGLD